MAVTNERAAVVKWDLAVETLSAYDPVKFSWDTTEFELVWRSLEMVNEIRPGMDEIPSFP